jgi:hypothetical protein
MNRSIAGRSPREYMGTLSQKARVPDDEIDALRISGVMVGVQRGGIGACTPSSPESAKMQCVDLIGDVDDDNTGQLG